MAFLDKLFRKKSVDSDATEKIKCKKCGAEILLSTAKKYKGKCAPCAHGRDIAEERGKKERREQKSKTETARVRATTALIEQQVSALENKWAELLRPLPQKAQLAFAARCVRRIYSLVKNMRELEGLWNLMEQVTTNAEKIAGSTKPSEEIYPLDSIAVSDSVEGISLDRNSLDIFFEMMLIASDIGLCAKDCKDPNKTVDLQPIAKILAHVEYTCGIDFGKPFPKVFFTHLHQDLELLKKNSRTQNWMDDMPVPVEFFGPLWPDGPPKGWPV